MFILTFEILRPWNIREVDDLFINFKNPIRGAQQCQITLDIMVSVFGSVTICDVG